MDASPFLTVSQLSARARLRALMQESVDLQKQLALQNQPSGSSPAEEPVQEAANEFQLDLQMEEDTFSIQADFSGQEHSAPASIASEDEPTSETEEHSITGSSIHQSTAGSIFAGSSHRTGSPRRTSSLHAASVKAGSSIHAVSHTHSSIHHARSSSRYDMSEDDIASVADSHLSAEHNTETDKENEHVGGSTPSFKNIVQKVMDLNLYTSDPVVTSFPQLKSTQIQQRPSHLRLPTSQYVLDTLKNYRDFIDHTTRKNPTKKVFFVPPPTLERVAETGDALRFSSKGVKQTVSVIKDIPLTPNSFYEIQRVKRAAVPPSRVRFQPTEAKQMELAFIWALKSANYMDHFTQRAQAQRKTMTENMKALSVWSRSGLPVTTEVTDTITSLQDMLVETDQIGLEQEPLFKSVVDTLIYGQAMFQLARRDDLLQLVAHTVDPLTIRAMRVSTFDGHVLFPQQVCDKALEQVREAAKNRSDYPRRSFTNSGTYGGFSKPGNKRRRFNSNTQRDFKNPREQPQQKPEYSANRNQGAGRGASNYRDQGPKRPTPNKRGRGGNRGARND